jgi:basic membrane protein A
MWTRKWFIVLSTVLAFSMLLLGCAGPAGQPAVKAPTELKIALVLETAVESPWNTAFLQSLERVQQEKPHGLTISYDMTESVAMADAERVLRQYADSGKYQIIWAHSGFSDAVNVLKKQYPNLLWVVTGAGNDPVGENAYWIDAYLHEPSYLMGIIAGKMTKTNVLGVVAAYPFPNVNIQVNGFIEGAKSVNPNVDVKVTYIESWFDPPKAKESALAQIAAGADFILAERFGVFDAAKEKGIFAFGSQVDQYDVAPEVVLTSAVIRFDPALKYIIEEWWNHETQGKAYNAPTQAVIYFMKDGGSDIAPFHGNESKISKEALEAVQQAKAKIMDGSLKVPVNPAKPE